MRTRTGKVHGAFSSAEGNWSGLELEMVRPRLRVCFTFSLITFKASDASWLRISQKSLAERVEGNEGNSGCRILGQRCVLSLERPVVLPRHRLSMGWSATLKLWATIPFNGGHWPMIAKCGTNVFITYRGVSLCFLSLSGGCAKVS